MPRSRSHRGALRTLMDWLVLGPLLVCSYAQILAVIVFYPLLWMPFLAIAPQLLAAGLRWSRCTNCSRVLARTPVGRTSLGAVFLIGPEVKSYFDEHLECLFCGHRTVETGSSTGSPLCGDEFVRAPAAERLCWLIFWLACAGLTVAAAWLSWTRSRR